MASDIPTSAALASSLKARSAHTTLSLTPSPNPSSPYHPPSAYPHQYHHQYHHHSPYPFRPASSYPLPLMDKDDRREESRYIKQEEPPHERISSPASPSPSASTPNSPHPPSHTLPPSSSSSSGPTNDLSEPTTSASAHPVKPATSGAHLPYSNDSHTFRQNTSSHTTQESPPHSAPNNTGRDHTPNDHHPDATDAMDKCDTRSDVAMEEVDETRQRDDDPPVSGNSNKNDHKSGQRSITPTGTNNNHDSTNASTGNKPNGLQSDSSPNMKRQRAPSSELTHPEGGTRSIEDNSESHQEHDHEHGDQENDTDHIQSDRSERGWTASPGPSSSSKPGRASSVGSSNGGGAGSPKPRKNSVSHAKKEGRPGVTATSCANCGTTTTPLWRRASNGQTICNACGLYFKARNLTRPPWLKRNMGLKRGEHSSETDAKAKTESSDHESGPSNNATADASSSTSASATATNDDEGGKSECSGSCPGDGNCNGTGGSSSCAGCPSLNQANRQHLVCANCRTTTTPLWRRDSSGNTICNACGLYFKLHNVHRPVTMKRAVIKRRKRVNLINTSPPLVPQQAMAQQGSNNGNNNGNNKGGNGARPSSPPLPDETDTNDPHGHHTATKRRRLQSGTGPNGTTGGHQGRVPNIEDYITPKRTANGQTEWIRRDPHDRRRSMSPIENIGSTHHEEGQHRMGDRYGAHNQGYHHQQGQQPPPQQHAPPRYLYNVHQGNGQPYHQPMMTMSRYPMHPPPPPPRVSSGPPQSPQHHSQQQQQQQPPQQAPQQQQQQPPQSPHHHPYHHQHSSPHHSHPSHMQGNYQPPIAPRMNDMDSMHSPHSPYGSSYASGWNHRLPGYATVSSSAFNTRLSSTGIVHSSGPGPGSPPLYPRQGPPPAQHQHYQYYRSSTHSQPNSTPPSSNGPSQGRGYHRSESPVPQGPPPPSSGHYGSGAPPNQGTPASAPPPSGYSSYHHHQLPPLVSGASSGHSPAPSGSGPPPAHHLPPISMPPSGHHVPLPRPSDIVHGEHHMHPPTSQQLQAQTPPSQQQQATPSHYQHHQRRPSSPNGPPPPPSSSSALAALTNGGPMPNAEILQQTRQEIQREMSHLSMLLGRAAAVLSGLDQALGNVTANAGVHSSPTSASNGNNGGNGANGVAPGQAPPKSNGASPPMHSTTVVREAASPGNPSLPPPPVANGHSSVDPKTSSALASLMALSASGGPPPPGYNGRPSMSHDDHVVDQGQQPPQPPQPSQQQQPQVPPPQHHMPPRIHQAMPYPLPRRRDRED
ncbi:putative electron transfer flavoprotein subunit [Actinomortierella wolfii]|nr:putative electron transfer flavoprotein subunit [Actinomortierella wolfii]